jgi:hypothetical protein
VIADVSLSAGWTWDYTLETLTMTRLSALYRHWRRHPPIHKTAAAFCGYQPPEAAIETPRAQEDPSGIGGLIARFPDGRAPAWR